MGRRWGWAIILAVMLILQIASLGSMTNSAFAPSPDLEIHFIDVDTGDAILIKVLIEGQPKWILIDGGYPGYGTKRIIPYMEMIEVRELEYVIATHYDGDHIGGLGAIFANYTVANLYGRNGTIVGGTFSRDWQIFKDYQFAMDAYVKGREQNARNFTLGSAEFILLTNGERPANVTSSKDDEDLRSLVYLLNYTSTEREFNILLGADCFWECETQIRDKLTDVEVYKVHGHGKDKERQSSSQALLDKIKPQISVISEGDHKGRPHEYVLDRLRHIGSKICRTDLHGNINFTISGNNFSIMSSKFNERCPDILTTNSTGFAKWEFDENSDKKIYVTMMDVPPNLIWREPNATQIIAIPHNQTISGTDIGEKEYPFRANVTANGQIVSLGDIADLTKKGYSFVKKLNNGNLTTFFGFDLIIDFNGDNELNGYDFRERAVVDKKGEKENDEWSSFRIQVKPPDTKTPLDILNERVGLLENSLKSLEDVVKSLSKRLDSLDNRIDNSASIWFPWIAIGIAVIAIVLSIITIVQRRQQSASEQKPSPNSEFFER